ncbi:MAG: RidA family protein [Spirochaetota bacterium]
MKKKITSTSAPAAIGPYSQALDLGNMLVISGQLPIDQASGLVPESAGEQTRRCMQNIQYILEEAGLGCEHVVRCGIFLKNMDDFSAVNEVYGSYFTEPYPARATVEVARLPKDVLVEIEALAVRELTR